MARQAKFDAISGAVGSAARMFAGFGGGERPLFGMGGDDPFSRGQYSETPDWLKAQLYDNQNQESTLGNITIG